MSYNDLTKGRYSQAGQEYHVTFTTQGRSPYFAQLNAAHLFCQTLHQLHHENKLHPTCWVLMPDHVHLLLQLQDGENLRDALQHLKGRSAHTINKACKRRGPLWQKSFFDRALRRDEDRLAIARYIVANPLRAGLLKRIGDCPYWDSVWL